MKKITSPFHHRKHSFRFVQATALLFFGAGLSAPKYPQWPVQQRH